MADRNHDSNSTIHPNSSSAISDFLQEEGSNTKKNGRGKTAGLSVSKKKRKRATGKLHVFIPTDKMVAVGPGASDFVTEISVLTKKHAPLNVKKWKDVPELDKENIVLKVLDTFDIDDSEHNRDVILDTSRRLYRYHRTRLHSHYKKFVTNEQALENKPDEVDEDAWIYLVNYFSSPDYKAMSERNKSNKAKQVINHICGRKSFQAISYDARDPDTGKEPNFQDLWQMTHMKNSGEWVDGASREVHLKVQEASSEKLQDINEDIDEDQIINEAFHSIVGKRTGYCRGLGVGIKPTRGKSTALNQELASEREKRHDIEMKLKEVEAQLQEERHKREEMASQFEETQRQHEERMEKQLEEKLAHIFFRTNPFTVGQFSGAMNIAAYRDHRVESTSNIFAQRETMDTSTTLRRESQDKVRRIN